MNPSTMYRFDHNSSWTSGCGSIFSFAKPSDSDAGLSFSALFFSDVVLESFVTEPSDSYAGLSFSVLFFSEVVLESFASSALLSVSFFLGFLSGLGFGLGILLILLIWEKKRGEGKEKKKLITTYMTCNPHSVVDQERAFQ